jgi:hypothetical protein
MEGERKKLEIARKTDRQTDCVRERERDIQDRKKED